MNEDRKHAVPFRGGGGHVPTAGAKPAWSPPPLVWVLQVKEGTKGAKYPAATANEAWNYFVES